MKTALVQITPLQILHTWDEKPATIDVPEVGVVNTPNVGWRRKNYAYVSIEDAAKDPEGKDRVGEPRYTLHKDKLITTFDLKDTPPPSIEDRLLAAEERLAKQVGGIIPLLIKKRVVSMDDLPPKLREAMQEYTNLKDEEGQLRKRQNAASRVALASPLRK